MEPQSPSKLKSLLFRIKNKLKERKLRRFLIGFGVVLFFLGVVFLLFPQKEAPLGPTPSPTISPLDLETQNWETFTNERLPVNFKYPSGLQVVESDGEFKLYTFGPGQIESTELFDGLQITFSKEELENETLRQLVNRQYAEIKRDPESKVTPLKEVVYGDLKGYVFSFQSLGANRFIYLSLSENEYLQIFDLTIDSSGFNYDEVVDLILSTLARR
jgi:hypothetical protein